MSATARLAQLLKPSSSIIVGGANPVGVPQRNADAPLFAGDGVEQAVVVEIGERELLQHVRGRSATRPPVPGCPPRRRGRR